MIEDLDFQNVATVLHFEELAEVAGRLACTEPDLPALPIGLDQKNLRFGLRRPRCSRGATRAGPAPRSGSTKPSLPRPPTALPARSHTCRPWLGGAEAPPNQRRRPLGPRYEPKKKQPFPRDQMKPGLSEALLQSLR